MSKNITRQHLADVLSERLFIKCQEANFLTDIILENMKNIICTEGLLKISGFGKFTVNRKSSRIGRNPKTGTEVVIPEHNRVSFYSSPHLKKNCNTNY